MTASTYIGRHLSEGVRGATINAIASSMPEVFTSLFFLFILQDASGFSGGIGATAGSAIFNSMVIPAVSILAVISMGLTNKITVSQKAMRRDGIALILAELIFLVLVSGSVLDWYHGLLLMLVYVAYIVYMFSTMIRKTDEEKAAADAEKEDVEEDEERPGKLKAFIQFNLEAIFLGNSPINGIRAWSLLIFSTFAIALVCYFLVIACEWIGAASYTVPGLGEFSGLNIPVMFVALILAAAASSFPDTIISMKDARRGHYDDAISNALGSNIFDICFALGLPLFIFTIIKGPIIMPPEVVDLSLELRFLLWLLTIVAILIFTSGPYMGRNKAMILLGIYVLFVVYVVGRGSGQEWAQNIADGLLSLVHFLNPND